MVKDLICSLAIGISLTHSVEAFNSADSLSVSVMTFNVRYDNPGDAPNHWANRRDWVGELIVFYRPDFVGTQEVLHRQLMDMKDRLPGYDHLGVGRDDGEQGGEYSAILYRTDKYEVINSSTFWLSETPERPGSMGWDAAFPRIVTWGEFRDRSSGRRFFLFNTHFDHEGVQARRESARLLLRKAFGIAGEAPAVVTGDFNAGPESDVYKILTGDAEHSSLFDAYRLASKPYGPEWTYTAFGNVPVEERQRIDYIFTSKKAKVEKYVTISEQRGAVFPSDHLPALAEIIF